MKKKLRSMLILMVIAILTLTGCGGSQTDGAPEGDSSSPALVGFSNLATSDVFCKLRQDSFNALASKDSSIKMIYTDANGDVNKQLEQVDNFIAQKVSAIILMPVDYAGIVPGIQKANDAGIPVLCLGISAESGDFTYVGSSNYNAGKMQGEYMAEVLPQGAKVLYLQGTPGLYHSTERWEGFKAACLDKRSDIELLANLSGNYERAKGMQITEDWIQTFPKFDAIIAANDQMALGAMEALKGANRLTGVMISGVDGTADACNAIKAGEMSQSIFQNAPGQAEQCYATLVEILAGKEVPKVVDVPFESITKDNVDQYLK